MATIQHKSHDRTVAHIAERNNINPRTPGMMVLVRDAIGDPYAGSGRAVYRWDDVQASWILMFKDNVETLTFTGESKTISQDHIQLSFVPANGQVWDVMVRDGLVVQQVKHSVAGSVVTIYPNVPGEFDGKQLSVRYAYGTMTQQLDLEIARVVSEVVGVFDKEALGLGNVDNTSDLNKPLSTAAQTALAGKSDTGHSHNDATTSTAGFMSAADKTKLDGVATNANNYTHPTGDGNLHVPATGTTNAGKVLTAGGVEGSLSWEYPLVLGSTAGAAPGTASAGASGTAARSDHVHPLQSSVTGNAATATKLETARTLTLGGAGKAFDGTANVAWTLAEIGAQAALVSGTNIKTVNSQSILGTGNIFAGLSNFTESLSTATPNNTTSAAALTTSGAATNIDFCMVAKGTGALLAQVPNGAVTGGNKRGQNATDFQQTRSAATQVASGDYSVISGGEKNTASGNYSAVGGGRNNATSGDKSAVGGGNGNTAIGNASTVGGGDGNTASGDFSTVTGGDTNTASGNYSVISGGGNNTASGTLSTIPGGYYATANGIRGLLAYGFCGAVLGQNQMAFWGGRLGTSAATPTRITSDTVAANVSNQLTLRNNSAFRVSGTVVARNTTTNDCKEWTFEALIKRGATAADTTIVGTPSITITFADASTASWGIAVTADTTNGALAITATGAASTSIRWTAVVHSIEVA